MKQPIHYLRFKHQTCRTPKGRKRSPVRGVSYDSDTMLMDKKTGNVFYVEHKDNTKVIYSNIFSSDPKTIYGKSEIPLDVRRTELWNDLYEENKSDDERIRAYCELAVPNFLTDEQMIELAKRMGNYFATTFRRPCDISVHKKPGNNHFHISLPERELKNGKWKQKRKKIYYDRKGNLIYDKNYYDEKGWDIRDPELDQEKIEAEKERRKKEGILEEVDPYERNPINGNYIYQKLGDRNAKKWKNDTHQGKWLEKEELSKAHDDVDEITNTYLKELGYEVTVKRNRKKVTEFLKENNLRQIHIPAKDYLLDNERKAELEKENQKRKYIQEKYEQILDQRENLQKQISHAEQKENVSETVKTLENQISKLERNLIIAKKIEDDLFQQYENSIKRSNEENPKKEKSNLFGPTPQNEKTENSRVTGNQVPNIFEEFKTEFKTNSYTAVMHLKDATLKNEIKYSDEIYITYFKNQRDKTLEKMIDTVLEKTSKDKPYLTHDYLKKHRKILKEIAEQYAPDSYEEWKNWSKISIDYYGIGHPKDKNVPGKQKSKNQENERDEMERTL